MGSFSRGDGVQHWHSIDTLNDGVLPPFLGSGNTVWPTANLAVYSPVIVRRRVVVKQLWYANHSTATGNYDIGLYDAGGTALLRRGSTSKSTNAIEIVWDCTDTTIVRPALRGRWVTLIEDPYTTTPGSRPPWPPSGDNYA